MKNGDETTIIDFQSKWRQLIGQGYCVLEDMLGAETLQKTRKVALNAVHKLSDEQLAAHRAPGTLINSKAEPGLADCIGNPKALAALGAILYPRSSGQTSFKISTLSLPVSLVAGAPRASGATASTSSPSRGLSPQPWRLEQVSATANASRRTLMLALHIKIKTAAPA